MKLAEFTARVIEAASRESPAVDAIDRDLVTLIVKLTLARVDLHVAPDGEIYNPAPDPKFMPAGMEARWGGGAIRRRRGPGR